MRADRIGRLLQLRRQAATEAKQALADALVAETIASGAVEAATAILAREAAAALVDTDGDGAVEAYIRWLPLGRRVLADAERGRERAMEEVGLARAALSAALASERAAVQLSEKNKAEQHVRRARSDANALDEIGRARLGG